MQSIEIETRRGSVVIRQATFEDAEQFRTLRLQALRDNPIAFPVDYEGSVNQPPGYWQDRLKNNENAILFFSEHGNELIGMTGIRRNESTKTKHSAWIWGVYVRPDWRGLHIAESLIEACIAWARSKGISIVKLGVTAASTSAVRCYQRCGFIIYGTEPRGIYHEGRYYDGYLMYRLLDDS